MNESVIGENLESILLDEDEKVKREDIFITGKLPINGLAEDKVSYFFDKSSSALRTRYLDLYLIHGPFSAKVSDSLILDIIINVDLFSSSICLIMNTMLWTNKLDCLLLMKVLTFVKLGR